MMRILLVEDESVTARMIKRKLAAESVEVDWMMDIERTLAFLSYDHYDAIVLDLGLPDGDGLTILKNLRRQGINIPILILTHRSAVEDRIAALENGADDYLTKPFSFAELLARLQALTRRVAGLWTGQLKYNGLTYAPGKRLMSYLGTDVKLSKREGQLLELLLRQKERTVDRETLLSHIWGPGEATPNSADTLAAQLRHKISALPSGIVINTVRGLGYRLTVCSEEELESRKKTGKMGESHGN
jgi:DNA-binding response OmpR family regulator